MEIEIPKKIYICHKNITCLKMTYTMWKKLNPDYEIYLFDDFMCEQFLLKEYSKLHRDIFKFIPDGPIKSDFWRVCILYHKGGIYVDADIHPLIPLSKYLILTSDFVTCITQENRKFNPHFIAVKNKEHILKLCIDEYVSLYTHHKHSYSYWNWSIVNIFNKYLSALRNTTVSTTVFKNKKFQFFIEKKKSNYHTTLHDYYCVFNNIKIFNTRYINYDPQEHKFKNETSVSERNNNNTNNIISNIIHLPKNIKRTLGKNNDYRKLKIVFQSRLPDFKYLISNINK
jgi:mannosyltransferase OCH1-like enzyme